VSREEEPKGGGQTNSKKKGPGKRSLSKTPRVGTKAKTAGAWVKI